MWTPVPAFVDLSHVTKTSALFLHHRGNRTQHQSIGFGSVQYIYLINQARGPQWGNVGSRSWQHAPRGPYKKRPKADTLPVRSRTGLVNKRFITRLKMLGKNATITDWKNTSKIKRAILIESRPGIYLHLMLHKTKGKESWKKKKKNLLCESKFFQKRKPQDYRKSSRVIVQDRSRQCPVQYLENIGPAMEQSNWLILFIGLLN